MWTILLLKTLFETIMEKLFQSARVNLLWNKGVVQRVPRLSCQLWIASQSSYVHNVIIFERNFDLSMGNQGCCITCSVNPTRSVKNRNKNVQNSSTTHVGKIEKPLKKQKKKKKFIVNWTVFRERCSLIRDWHIVLGQVASFDRELGREASFRERSSPQLHWSKMSFRPSLLNKSTRPIGPPTRFEPKSIHESATT